MKQCAHRALSLYRHFTRILEILHMHAVQRVWGHLAQTAAGPTPPPDC